MEGLGREVGSLQSEREKEQKKKKRREKREEEERTRVGFSWLARAGGEDSGRF